MSLSWHDVVIFLFYLTLSQIVIYGLNNDFDIDDAMLRSMLLALRFKSHNPENKFEASAQLSPDFLTALL